MPNDNTSYRTMMMFISSAFYPHKVPDRAKKPLCSALAALQNGLPFSWYVHAHINGKLYTPTRNM